jgi:hypothetical protein
MSKAQKSFNLDSNTKGWRIYKLKDVEKTIVARKGGPSAEQIKTSPSYKELRGNQSEFGAASALAKSLRMTLPKPMQDICESYVSGKLTGAFRQLAQEHEGTPGTRPILLSKYGHKLEGFNFHNKFQFSEVFKPKIYAKASSDRGKMLLHFSSYIPEDTILAPKGATHFRLFAHTVLLSDYFNEEGTEIHRPVHQNWQGKFHTYESIMQPLCKIPLEPMTAQLSVLEYENIPFRTGLILIAAIRFYQQKNNDFVDIEKGNSMQILKVF